MKDTEKKKQQNNWSHWTAPERRTITLVCACGMRYIKTRARQTTCLMCMRRAADEQKR
jgi:hypothetical protein